MTQAEQTAIRLGMCATLASFGAAVLGWGWYGVTPKWTILGSVIAWLLLAASFGFETAIAAWRIARKETR